MSPYSPCPRCSRLAQRLFNRAAQDANTDRLVFVRTFELLERLLRADQRDAAEEFGNTLLQLLLSLNPT